MSSDILLCLQAVIDPNTSVRAQAEEHIKQYENQPGFGIELCRILLTATYDITQRQTAAGVLKQFVKAKWEVTEENKVPIDEKEKAAIREHLLPSLSDPNALIRTSIAMVISRIAKADWPERWPNLMPTLINMLHDTNESVVHGGIITLSMLLTDDTISDVHLPLVVRHLFPEILKIFQSSQYSEQIRVKAAQIFEAAVNFIFLVQTEECDNLLKPVASEWVQTFIQAIAHSPPSLSRRDYGIPCTALQTLTSLLKSSPNLLKAHLLALLPPVWEAFTRGLAVYEQVAVRGDEASMQGPMGEDGMGIDGMAKAVLEFMQELADKRSIKKMMEPHLENIVYYSIGSLAASPALDAFVYALKSGTPIARERAAALVVEFSQDETARRRFEELNVMALLQRVTEIGNPNAKKHANNAIRKLQEPIEPTSSSPATSSLPAPSTPGLAHEAFSSFRAAEDWFKVLTNDKKGPPKKKNSFVNNYRLRAPSRTSHI